MTDHEWDVKCQAMFLAIHAACNLARDAGLDVHLMLELYQLQQIGAIGSASHAE